MLKIQKYPAVTGVAMLWYLIAGSIMIYFLCVPIHWAYYFIIGRWFENLLKKVPLPSIRICEDGKIENFKVNGLGAVENE